MFNDLSSQNMSQTIQNQTPMEQSLRIWTKFGLKKSLVFMFSEQIDSSTKSSLNIFNIFNNFSTSTCIWETNIMQPLLKNCWDVTIFKI